MKSGVIFDMDGVLIDSEFFYQNRRLQYLREKGRPIDPNWDFIGSNEKAIWETIVPEDSELREQMKLDYRKYQIRHPIVFSQVLDPQVPNLFRKLHQQGIRIAIASSSDRTVIEAMMEYAGICNFVDFYISGEECTAHKPAPDIYQAALRGIELLAEQVIAVEDSAAGIAAAKAANLYTCALHPRHGEKIVQEQADIIIKDLTDVLSII